MIRRLHRLKLFTVTNGTAIFTPERAEELARCGPSKISVSFDGVRPEVHDRLRGVRGAHAKAARAVRLRLEERRTLGSDLKVHAMLLLCRSTYEDLDAAYDFALNELGVDKLSGDGRYLTQRGA